MQLWALVALAVAVSAQEESSLTPSAISSALSSLTESLTTPTASASESLSATTASESLSLTSSLASSALPTSTSNLTSSAVTSEVPTSTESASVPASTTVTDGPATVTPIKVPFQNYTFTPWPIPSSSPDATQFDPLSPPEVENHGTPRVIPDWRDAWDTAYNKAADFIANLTLEEKVNITTGSGWQNDRCVGNIPPIGDWNGLCLMDSPLGIRFADYVTAFPSGINAAATWNRRLIRTRGLYMGREFAGKGVNIALGPMMNMGRVARGGRNYEGFGSDPYLTGESAYETILGMQQGGVQACAKHFINNEQEYKRTLSSSVVDDRTQHEIYAHPFLRSVMAGVASVMCSYNLINSTYACENDKMQNDVLKREYGFRGFIMSDWQATMSTLSAVAGLDMTMPGDITFNSGDSYFGGNLTAFVNNGTIDIARVDDMATRIIAGYYFLHQDDPDFPAVNFDSWSDSEETNAHIDVQYSIDEDGNEIDHSTLVREMGAGSIVLLKNVGNALPLKKPRSMVLIGSDAGPARTNGPNTFADRGGVEGILAMGWGSGTANFTYLISPYEALQRRARVDRTSFSWSFDDYDTDKAGNVVIGKSVAMVFVKTDGGEEFINVDGNIGDRKNLTLWDNGENLIKAVAAQNNNTIVVVHSVGPVIIESWIDHPNVTAVLWAGVSGTETGNALTDVVYGDWNPSGRLPYTIAKSLEDYGVDITGGGAPQDVIEIPYSEELLIDYRWFDAKNITPRYEFGFGLSYTNFTYTNLKIEALGSSSSHENRPEDEPVNRRLSAKHVVSPQAVVEEEVLVNRNLNSAKMRSLVEERYDGGGDASNEKAWDAGEATSIEEGSSIAAWLHKPAYEVSFHLENTGDVFGGEIPQLYVHFPSSSGEPPSVLRGFTNTEELPGEKKKITLSLSRYDLSIWDVEKQGWRRPSGTIELSVGRSSRDLVLKGTVPGSV